MVVLRSFGSVLAGFITVVLLSTLTDEIMHATGIIPRGAMWNPWHNALALAYRCVATVAGGYVTARLAPRAPMRHAVILGVLGPMAGIAGVLATWDMNLGPRWYPIAIAVTGFPCVWLGGWLQQRKR
jgi:hypothetical protein